MNNEFPSDYGKGESIAGFVTALVSLLFNIVTFGFLAVAGFILSVMGAVKSKKAGKINGFSIAGMIISAFSAIATIAVIALVAFVAIVSYDGDFDCLFSDEGSCSDVKTYDDDPLKPIIKNLPKSNGI